MTFDIAIASVLNTDYRQAVAYAPRRIILGLTSFRRSTVATSINTDVTIAAHVQFRAQAGSTIKPR